MEDFWYFLTLDGKEEALGITKQNVYDTMYQMAIAEKCQTLCAARDGRKFEDYNFSSEDYLELLKKYPYSIKEEVLERINFGSITLVH